MLHSLEQFTKKYVEFNASELFTLASLFKPVSFNENDFIIKKSQRVSNIYFLDSGVVKSYIEKNNRMYNVKFHFKPILFSDLNAIINKKKSTRTFVTVKKSNVFMANFDDILKLNENSEKHKRFFEMIFEDDYVVNSNLFM
ncbi:MAG: cyclic nucleotide-binding domain-containing protein [Flavobacterium sp.]|nr:cyclic nucleotide-binding domain-containing protein [Flavobacterium sp.]